MLILDSLWELYLGAPCEVPGCLPSQFQALSPCVHAMFKINHMDFIGKSPGTLRCIRLDNMSRWRVFANHLIGNSNSNLRGRIFRGKSPKLVSPTEQTSHTLLPYSKLIAVATTRPHLTFVELCMICDIFRLCVGARNLTV